MGYKVLKFNIDDCLKVWAESLSSAAACANEFASLASGVAGGEERGPEGNDYRCLTLLLESGSQLHQGRSFRINHL